MVKFAGKGHFKRTTTFDRAATGLEGTSKSKFEIEYGIVIYKFMFIYKFMSLSIMQLLSAFFKCKIYYLFNYYFRILKPVLGLLFEDTLIYFFF